MISLSLSVLSLLYVLSVLSELSVVLSARQLEAAGRPLLRLPPAEPRADVLHTRVPRLARHSR